MLQRHRVVVTDFTEPGHDIESDVFANSGLAINLVTVEEAGRSALPAAAAGAHALMVQFARIDRVLIGTLTSCRVIARYGVGVDMIDIDAATDMGIAVANVPHYCVDEVSLQTIGFLLDLNRRTLPLAAHVRAGRWGTAPPVTPPSRLRGQLLGVVGFGAIGSEVARKARALGLEVIAYDPFAVADRHPGISFVPLTRLLAQSDYVTLHCPLTEATRGLAPPPTAIGVLHGRNPPAGARNRFRSGGAARGPQTTQGQECSVDVIHAPAPIPTAIGFLRRDEILDAPVDGFARRWIATPGRGLPSRGR